tara:strand:+ start:174 stop:290 length:117 start_codon:yes stop_codon:yes gene_type:complete
MVQLKRELNYLGKKQLNSLKSVDFIDILNLKKPQNRAK